MKIMISFTLALIATLILGACAGGGGVQTVQRSPQDVARLMSVNDNIIVFGERVGPVFLGMTEEQLYKRMGNPDRVTHGYWSDIQQDAPVYYWEGIVTSMMYSKVHSISVYPGRYHTAEGISVGTSELELKAKLGKPAWDVLEYRDSQSRKLCYNPSGTIVILDNGVVKRFELSSGKCE
jgi:hypothetical protein